MSTDSQGDKPDTSEQVIESESNTDASQVAPLIVWGEDGVPVLNEVALEPPASEAPAPTDTQKRKKKKKKNRGEEEELLPEFVEEKEPSMQFVVRTNLPLAESPVKTRMQEFYEFAGRLNRKHTIALPDSVLSGDSLENEPLFTDDELTSTNRTGQPMRLMTSFETKIRLVNESLKFVVLDYSYEPIPPLETRLSIYRAEKRIGTIKITGPIQAGSVVAIILEGSPRVGDIVLREAWQ